MLRSDLLFSLKRLLLQGETKEIISGYVEFSRYLSHDSDARFAELSLFGFHSRVTKPLKIAETSQPEN